MSPRRLRTRAGRPAGVATRSACRPTWCPAHVVVMDAFPTNGERQGGRRPAPSWQATPARVGVRTPARPPPTVASRTDHSSRRPGGRAGRGRSSAVPARSGPGDDVLDDLGGKLAGPVPAAGADRAGVLAAPSRSGRILEDTTIAGLAALVGAEADGPGCVMPVHAGAAPSVRCSWSTPTSAPPCATVDWARSSGPSDRWSASRSRSSTGPDRATRTSVEEMADEAVHQIRSHPASRSVSGGRALGRRTGGLRGGPAPRARGRGGVDGRAHRQPGASLPLHYLWAEAVLNWPDIRSGDRLRRHRHVEALPLEPARRFRRHGTEDRVGSTITRSYRSSKEAVRDYHPGPTPVRSP